MIQIQNNFLSNVELQKIMKIIKSNNFLWSMLEEKPITLLHHLVGEQGKHRSYFVDYILADLAKRLKAEIILESNLILFAGSKKQEEYKHESNFLKNKNYKSCVLHLNSNNGYTKILGLEKIDCVENRAILSDMTTRFTEVNCNEGYNKMVLYVHYY